MTPNQALPKTVLPSLRYCKTAAELEVFEVALVALIIISAGAGGRDAGVSSRMLQNHPNRIEGAKVQNKSCQGAGRLLRVAASSNLPFQRTRAGTAHR